MVDFLEAVRSTLQRSRMFRSGDRVLVAASGGPDSSALLAALVALRQPLRLTLRAAYVDHGLRPRAAQREATRVRVLGKRWGVPVHVLRCTVKKRGGESPEAVAREARYEALLKLARRSRCPVVALGHTLDDQAETVLMRLLRGTGVTGLAGIPPVRKSGKVRLVRPLLECSRAQVEAFLKAHGVRPLQDRSNRSARFLRNRIRLKLLPLLEQEYNPAIRQRLCTLADLFSQERRWVEQELQARARGVLRVRGAKARLDRRRMRTFPAALRRHLLRRAVERLAGSGQGFSADHWLRLDDLAVKGTPKAQDLPHGLRAQVREGGLLVLESRPT